MGVNLSYLWDCWIDCVCRVMQWCVCGALSWFCTRVILGFIYSGPVMPVDSFIRALSGFLIALLSWRIVQRVDKGSSDKADEKAWNDYFRRLGFREPVWPKILDVLCFMGVWWVGGAGL